jgi:hypothetical protein
LKKNTRLIRTKPSTAEEHWYRTYHLDLGPTDELDSSQEEAERLLNWKVFTKQRPRTSHVYRNRYVKKKLPKSSHRRRSGSSASGNFCPHNTSQGQRLRRDTDSSKSPSSENSSGDDGKHKRNIGQDQGSSRTYHQETRECH